MNHSVQANKDDINKILDRLTVLFHCDKDCKYMAIKRGVYIVCTYVKISHFDSDETEVLSTTDMDEAIKAYNAIGVQVGEFRPRSIKPFCSGCNYREDKCDCE